jgi:hypothetical protein
MAASGKKDKMSAAELNQRKAAGQASTVHGAYAFASRGQEALPETRRSRVAELVETVQTRAGVLSLLQDRCVRALIMVELVESFVIEEKGKGKLLQDIPIFNKLPAFQNSAQRCVQALLHELHDDTGVLDVTAVLRDIDDNGYEDQTNR